MNDTSEKIDLRHLGEQIATALTATTDRHWHVPPPDSERDCRHFVNIIDSADPECQLNINNSWASKGRLTIGGSYPRHNGHYSREGEPNRITVAPDKSPEAIAKDINRRFLPAYLAALANAKRRRDTDVSWENNRNTLARELAARCNTEPSKQSPGQWSAYRNDGGYLSEGETSGDGTVKLDLRNLSADKARRIIAILMEP